MGSYTTNYQLYLPSIGEIGWGDLVNANFTILDTKLKSGTGITADKLATSRSFSITDGTNTGTAVSFDGTTNVSLRLPTTIVGTATQADKLLLYLPSDQLVGEILPNDGWIATHSGYVYITLGPASTAIMGLYLNGSRIKDSSVDRYNQLYFIMANGLYKIGNGTNFNYHGYVYGTAAYR